MGKTALALAIARNAAVEHKKSIGFFSLEMSEQHIGERLLASESRVNSHHVKTSKNKIGPNYHLQQMFWQNLKYLLMIQQD